MENSGGTANNSERGRPFPKGVSGNPNGRPKKGYSISEMMKEMLSNTPEVKRDLGNAILKKALQGDIAAQKLIWQYMDGMPIQGMELTGKDGDNIPILVTVKYE